MSNPDGRVDPGKGTAKALASADAPPQPPGDPSIPGKLDLSPRNPKHPVPLKSDSKEDDSGDFLDQIVEGVEDYAKDLGDRVKDRAEDFVDDFIKPRETPGSEEELDFDPELVAKVADRIIAKLKAGKSIKPEIQVLEGTSMQGVLEAMVKLKKAGKLDTFSDQLRPEHRRVGAAVYTIRPLFEEPWPSLVTKLSPKDREAILERTPENIKIANGFGEEPADPEHTEPGENPAEGKITVDDKGIAVAASLTFKAQEKNFGKTEFTVQLDPSGSARAFDLNLTLIARNLNEEGFLAGFLGKRVALNVSLSLNASVELTKKQTKTVLKEVREAVKAEVELKFKLIPVLKRVSLKFSVFGGAHGVSFGPALAVSF
jgi:hypothetical protein